MRIVEALSTGAVPQQTHFHAAPGPEAELSGTVKWFKPDKGFGFITADDSAKDVFVHKSVLRRSGLGVLEAGQRVQMRVQEVEKGREATWVMPL
jgi:CspA family cold shock protein